MILILNVIQIHVVFMDKYKGTNHAREPLYVMLLPEQAWGNVCWFLIAVDQNIIIILIKLKKLLNKSFT